MKTYKFAVSLCRGWCNGNISIDANNEEEAYDKAMDYVVDKLVKAFPTLDIEYNVECENPDDEECCTAFKFNQNGIISTVSFSNEECAIEYAKEYRYHKVVNDTTCKIVWKNEDLI